MRLSAAVGQASSIISLLRSVEWLEGLHVDGLQLESRGMMELLTGLSSMRMRQLRSLSWTRMQLNFTEAEKLGEFIRRQGKLEDLDLSLGLECSSVVVKELIEKVGKKGLRRLVVGGMPQLSLKGSLTPLLKMLCESGELKVLDVSGQGVPYSTLRMAIESGVEELYFDGSLPESAEQLRSFLEYVLESPLKATAWPEDDIARLDAARDFAPLEAAFAAKFGVSHHCPGLLRRRRRRTLTEAGSRPERPPSALEAALEAREKEVAALLAEVLNVAAIPNVLAASYTATRKSCGF